MNQRQVTQSTCPYCGVGCGVLIETQREADGSLSISDVSGDPKHPANFGRLCTKGSNLHKSATPLALQGTRLASPMHRNSRSSALRPIDWDGALNDLAQRFAKIIKEHGPDAVAFYVSGQLLTEDYYVFNKLAKGLIGTNNIDTNSRLCMSSAVAGYKATLGADAPPCSYEDIDFAGTLFIAGSNTAFAHPVLYRRIEEARRKNPNLRTIVVDPRRTETAREAELFLPILPGTDVALFQGMLHHLLWEGLIDQQFIADHTEGFDAVKAGVRDTTTSWAAQVCGVPKADIEKAAQWFAAGPTLSLYCQGLNQSAQGSAKNAALINLHLATRQIGKPGAGPFSLTGQPNAMGGREVGGLANLISAHRDMANPVHRAEVAQLWSVESVPEHPGLTAVELFNALESGKVKAVWIVCTDPAHSLPNLSQVNAALAKAELVVVQDCFSNVSSMAYADYALPATTWGEKEGTVTNSERRISRVRAALPPFEKSRHDWVIARDFANRLAPLLADHARAQPTFDYPSSETVWNEHRESTRGRDLDITGLSYAVLEREGPQQWPFVTGASQGKVRLYEDGKFATANGKARFEWRSFVPMVDKTSARFPLTLTTGRSRDQWHTMSRTGIVPSLFSHEAEPWLDMNELDLARRSLRDGAYVSVVSPRGRQTLRVRASSTVRSGQVYFPMHWGPVQLMGGGINHLTQPAFDSRSKQPELKASAVRVEKLDLQHELFLLASCKSEQQSVIRTQIMVCLKRHRSPEDYGLIVPVALNDSGEYRDHGLLIKVAGSQPISAQLRTDLEQLFEIPVAKAMRYVDNGTGQFRAIWLQRHATDTNPMNAHIRFVMATGAGPAESWVKQLFQDGTDVSAMGNLLLQLGAHPPSGVTLRGAVICNCYGVNQTTIDSYTSLADLQQATGCGTNCGSCLPELKAIFQSNSGVEHAA